MSEFKSVVCVFSKAPIKGEVKTRLISELGEQGACELYKSLLSGTLKTVSESRLSDVRLYCYPDIEHEYFHQCAIQFPLKLCQQRGVDLGQRMYAAMERESKHYPQVIIIGSDCPWIRAEDIQLAQEKLASGTEVVLGPAQDGGYYLVAASKADSGLFRNISWGSSLVLGETRAYLQEHDVSWYELPEYSDIDRPEDLPAYRQLLQDNERSAELISD